MDKAVQELLAKAPGAVIAIGVIILIIYLFENIEKLERKPKSQ